MNIVVCVKPAPDPQKWEAIQLHPATKALQREGIRSVLGPLDKRALEEGIRIKERHSGKVRVMTMAPPSARENLMEALAMGAEEAYLLSDRAFAGSDTWSTALVLTRAIQKLSAVDLVFCGSWSLDGSTGHVGAQLAEILGWANVSQVIEVEGIQGGAVRTKSRVENGTRILETPVPVLLSVNREINIPRFTSLLGVVEAETKPLFIWTAADLGISPEEVGFLGSPTRTGELFMPEMRRKTEMLQGDPEELAREMIQRIRQAIG